MNRYARFGTNATLATVLLLTFTMTASAHGGENHTDAVSAILHQGLWGLLIMALLIGVVSAASWRRTRRSVPDQQASGE